jgi:major membrane immunogen (membrane-anchored lipoprotein)
MIFNIKNLSGFSRPAALCVIACFLAVSCTAASPRQGKMSDGYYSACAAEFDSHGWKEFVTIYIHHGKIAAVDYNAKNSSGFIKSWDMDYMRRMDAEDGTYPNEYTRAYANALLARQDPALVEVISGATVSHSSFRLLAEAALVQAKDGSTGIAFVPIPEEEE